MKTSGDFSRYYCFDHETDFESRKKAATHLVQVHEMPKKKALEKLDEIDEQYDDMESFDDEVV